MMPTHFVMFYYTLQPKLVSMNELQQQYQAAWMTCTIFFVCLNANLQGWLTENESPNVIFLDVILLPFY